jgi:hypothetical protein
MPLDIDRIAALERRPELPEGSPTLLGAKVSYGGTDDEGDHFFEFVRDEDSEIIKGNGDPNDEIAAPKGTLFVDKDAPALWQNTDGYSTWTNIAGGAAANFWEFNVDELHPNPTTTAGNESIFIAFGSSDRSQIYLFDDNGTAADQFLTLLTAGEFTMLAGSDSVVQSATDLDVVAGGTLTLSGGPATHIGDFIDMTEVAAPAAPASNEGRIYMRDNGGGKTQLVVRFPTGAVQVIATEP